MDLPMSSGQGKEIKAPEYGTLSKIRVQDLQSHKGQGGVANGGPTIAEKPL